MFRHLRAVSSISTLLVMAAAGTAAVGGPGSPARTATGLPMVPGASAPRVPAPAGSSPTLAFAQGDLFLSELNGQVQERKPNGTLVQTLNAPNTNEGTGSAFDKNGNLYVTEFQDGAISKFDSTGHFISHFGSGFNSDPESIVFDTTGNMYVGQADGTHNILKFSSSGALLKSFSPAVEDRGTDWIDLASDQCTIRYTSELTSVKRFNVCTNTQLPDFATGLPGSKAYAHRILPDGGELVADSGVAVRLNTNGAVIKTYHPPPADYLLFALNLDPDGKSFWTADARTGDVFHFDIGTGAQLGTFSVGRDVGGISLLGERCASGCQSVNYVALGDSYSSGEGNPPFDLGTAPIIGDGCDRSSQAWPRLDGVSKSWHLACSGAKHHDLINGQHPDLFGLLVGDNIGQIPRLAKIEATLAAHGNHVTDVTLTIGGNNIDFSLLIGECFFFNCSARLNGKGDAVKALLSPIMGALRTIHKTAPKAKVTLVGYPQIFPTLQSGNVTCGWLTPTERIAANTLTLELETMMQRAAKDAPATYVSTLGALSGHELCTSDSWMYPINPVRYGLSSLQGHPILPGQLAMATLVAPALH